MTTFNYPFWIDRLSDEGYRRCLSLLCPMLHFQYMKEKDIRRIDLSERMYDLAKDNPMYPGYNSGMSFQAYFKALQYYIENFLECTRDSIAERYRERALAILNAIEKDSSNVGVEDELTAFAIYLGLSRELYGQFKTHNARFVTPLVCKEDAELLFKLKEYPFKKEIPGIFKKTEEQAHEAKEMIYMHNVIMFCLLMDAQGEFDEEE